MTWVPSAVQRGLREVADRGLVHPAEQSGCRAPLPGFSTASPLHYEWKKRGNACFSARKVSKVLHMHSHNQADARTHTHTHRAHHTYPPVFVSRHPFFLNASLL